MPTRRAPASCSFPASPTPGHSLRVQRHVGAVESLGIGASWMKLAEVPMRRGEIEQASVVVIWRAVNCPEVVEAIAAARSGGGAKLVFDVDDLMFKPELASEEIIDGNHPGPHRGGRGRVR